MAGWGYAKPGLTVVRDLPILGTMTSMQKLRCKRCAVDYVRQSRRSSALDRVLGAIHMYLFRCQLCAHRFWAIQTGASDRRPTYDDDRREFQRLAIRIPVSFSSEQKSGDGFVTDLSIRGCALQTDTRPHHGAVLSLTLHPADSLPPIEVESTIIRSALGQRVGVEFLEMDPDEEERLRGYIETLIVTDPDELRKAFSNF
jgi:hypothetical protein